MPARILVQSRGYAQGDFLISEEVLRIGSDANCHLVIPSTTPHTLTLRYENGRYTVFNRSGQPVELESTYLEANNHALWKPGEDLTIEGDLVLTLRVEGNPAPIRPNVESSIINKTLESLPEEEPEVVVATPIDDEPAPAVDNSGFYAQLIMIVLCFGVAGGLIFADSAGLLKAAQQPRTQAEIEADFSDLISRLTQLAQQQPRQADELFLLRRQLQDAYSQEVRGLNSRAVELYTEIRRLVSRWRDPVRGAFPEGTTGELYRDVDNFAALQLQPLQSR